MLTNLARTIIMTVLGLVMVPYYIGELGLATYAIIPLATSVSSYVLVIVEALGSAFGRYTSIAIQQNDMQKASKVYSTSVFGMARTVLAMVPAVVLISIAAPYVFRVGGNIAFDVQAMFIMVLMSSLLVSFSASMGSVYTACNKLYVIYCSRAAYTVVNVAVIVTMFFLRGPSLIWIGIAYVAASAIMMAIIVGEKGKAAPGVCVSRDLYDRGLLKEMFSLGGMMTVGEFGFLLFMEGLVVTVNICLGSEVQGTFSIAANVISITGTAALTFSTAAVPLIYRYYASKSVADLTMTIRVFTKFLGLLLAFPIAFLIVFMPQIIELWLGPSSDYDDLYNMLYLMLPLQIAVSTTRVVLDVPVAYAKMKPIAAVTAMLGIANVTAAMALLTFTDVGVLGACVCWIISTFLLKIVFYPLYASKLTGTGPMGIYRPMLQTYAVFVVLAAAGFGISEIVEVPARWFWIVASFAVAFLAYLVVAMRFGFSKDERHTAVEYLPKFVQRVLAR